MIDKEMVEKFQCSGCAAGSDTGCGSYKQEDYGEHFTCASHCAGTSMLNGARLVSLYLGLPKGFNRIGNCKDKTSIRLYIMMPTDLWNHLNVPVWAMEEDGYLFVRTYCPRTDVTFVDVVKGGKISEMPLNASAICGESKLVSPPIDVGTFIKEID